jgi:hypothetical protein
VRKRIFIILVILDILIVWICVNPPRERSHLAERWVVDRMKNVHGISASMGDEVTGESWFYNQRGQRCKL